MGRLVQLLFFPHVRLLEGTGPLGQKQESTCCPVHHRLGDLSGLDSLHQSLAVPTGRSGHLQVQPGNGRGSRRPGSEPVRDHDAVKAPFAPQHRVQHPPVLGGVGPVDPVVRGHHPPGAALGDRHLERTHRDLPQGPLVHFRRDGRPLELGVVGHEVLDRRTDTTGLHTADEADGDPAGQVRVLRHALEVPPAQWRPVQVDRRGQQHVTTPGPSLRGQHPTQFLDQPRVPGGPQRRTTGDADRRRARAKHAGPAGAVRAVGHLQRRDAQAVHRLHRPEVTPPHQRHLLRQRQVGQQPVDLHCFPHLPRGSLCMAPECSSSNATE